MSALANYRTTSNAISQVSREAATPAFVDARPAHRHAAPLAGSSHMPRIYGLRATSRPEPQLPGDAEQRRDGLSRRNLFQSSAVLLFGCGCSLCGAARAEAAGWGYGIEQFGSEALEGPASWGGVCQTGTRQSPVNIQLRERVGRAAAPTVNEGLINCMYSKTELCTVTNTGHGTMQVAFPPGNRVTIGTKFLELLQFHFHTPSEHAVDGRRFPMEAHMVHKDLYTGDLTVLGVMITRGSSAENACLRLAMDCTPEVCNKYTTFDPSQLLPKSMRQGKSAYVYYEGSLTTPPCTEVVNWYIFTDPVAVTDEEILDFEEFAGSGMTLGMNARPIQRLNDRTFTYYDGKS